MIKIILKESFPLNRGVLRLKYEKEYDNLEYLKVKELLESNSQIILSSVEELTGFVFEKKDISFWAIGGSYPSIPHPNLLNVEQEVEKIVFDICSILTHNILLKNDFYEEFLTEEGILENELEATTYLVSLKVLERVFCKEKVSLLRKQLEEEPFSKYLWDEVKGFEKKDLLSKPLKNQAIKDFLRG
jgi:hypothetical protein